MRNTDIIELNGITYEYESFIEDGVIILEEIKNNAYKRYKILREN